MALHDFGWVATVDLAVVGSVSLYWYKVTLPTCKNKHISNLVSSVEGSLHAGRFSTVAARHVAEKQR